MAALLTLHLLAAARVSSRFREIKDEYFSSAPRLRRLLLTGNQLTALPGSLARSCRRLQFLQVGSNQLVAISMEPRRCVGFDEEEDSSNGQCLTNPPSASLSLSLSPVPLACSAARSLFVQLPAPQHWHQHSLTHVSTCPTCSPPLQCCVGPSWRRYSSMATL